MNDILEKSWQNTSSTKKFLSRVITYQLSRHLDCHNYEVVYEGCLEKGNPASEKPDVVVFRKNDLQPMAAIEISKTEDLTEMMVLAKRLKSQYGMKEFFIYDYDTDVWYCEAKNFNQTNFSTYFNLDLKGMVSLFCSIEDDRLIS